MPEEQKYTFEEWTRIAKQLNKQLGPEFLSQRPGPSGRTLTYIEGKTAIQLANEIFGFNGWSTEIKEIKIDFMDIDENRRVSVGVAVTVRITLKDGTFHEDQGYGAETNGRNKAAAIEKARKQGVTDATKRTLRFFGNALGNCLYDGPYLGGIGKMAKPSIKFTPKNLYRHEQFGTPKTEAAAPPPQQAIQAGPSKPLAIESRITYQPPQPQNKRPVTTPPQQQVQAEQKVEAARQSLMEPIIPEDSYSYEGDDEFLVQMLAADEDIDFHVDDEIDNEMLAGILTPPALSVPSSQQVKREPASLSDGNTTDDQQSKKQKVL